MRGNSLPPYHLKQKGDMQKMNEEIIKLYSYGYSIEVLSEDFEITEDDVLKIIRDFKKENTPKKRLSEPVKKLMIARFKSGIHHSTIEREIGVGKRSLYNLLKRMGFHDIDKKEKTFDYKVIEHDSFEICPDCGSSKVNEIRDLIEEIDYRNKNSYCMNCGTEWYLEKGEIRKVIFENIV